MILPPVFTDAFVDVSQLLLAMDHRVSVTDNLQMRIITVTAPGTVDTEFTVAHGLGEVPLYYVWNVDRAAIVYDSRRGDWTEADMYLKCDTVSAVITLVVGV